MGETVKVTDLTQTEAEPTERAECQPALEHCGVTIKMPGGSSVVIDTTTLAGSRLATAITVLLLVAAGCLALAVVAGVNAGGISVPYWAALGSFLLPAALYLILIGVKGKTE